MEKKPLSVFAVNATVTLNMTATGKTTCRISHNYNSGDAVDRIQECYDYRLNPIIDSMYKINEQGIFQYRHTYITFEMHPRTDDSNYLITCSCEVESFEHKDVLRYIEQGMQLAREKMYEMNTKLSGTR